MATLKTNYKDDILDTSVNTQRKYRMVNNADGTISLEDVTVYTQNGDSFGAADINKTNQEVLDLNSSLVDKTLVPIYNSEDDYFYVNNQKWMFAGINSFYLFKPNVGIQCEYDKGGYTNVSLSQSCLDAYPNTSSQYQHVFFKQDLTEYIGKNKKIRFKCYFSDSNSFSVCRAQGVNSSGSQQKTINFTPSTIESKYEYELDSLISASYPYFGIGWHKPNTTVHLYITEVVIVNG